MAFTEEERRAAFKLAKDVQAINRGHRFDCTCAICRAWMYLYSVGINHGFNAERIDNPSRNVPLVATATDDNPEGKWLKRG